MSLNPQPHPVTLACNYAVFFSSALLLSKLELSDTEVYEPDKRALLGNASHFCQVVVLKPPTASGDPGVQLRGLHAHVAPQPRTVLLVIKQLWTCNQSNRLRFAPQSGTLLACAVCVWVSHASCTRRAATSHGTVRLKYTHTVQEYLAHKKQCPPRTLHYDYCLGWLHAHVTPQPRTVLLPSEKGTPLMAFT